MLNNMDENTMNKHSVKNSAEHTRYLGASENETINTLMVPHSEQHIVKTISIMINTHTLTK